MNNASIVDVLQSTDSESPYFVAEMSKKVQKDNGEYQVTLIFDDHLS
jgi:hypothetical protein